MRQKLFRSIWFQRLATTDQGLVFVFIGRGFVLVIGFGFWNAIAREPLLVGSQLLVS
jgi:hypothetical protein